MVAATNSEIFSPVSMVAKNSDAMMAMSVVGVLLIMIIPLPPIMLDLLLTLNITLSLVILLVGMYILKPLEFSAFPSVLLLVTLFRLSLNIASTRIILLTGNQGVVAAGKIINLRQFCCGWKLSCRSDRFFDLGDHQFRRYYKRCRQDR